jgi:hypothetical protein
LQNKTATLWNDPLDVFGDNHRDPWRRSYSLSTCIGFARAARDPKFRKKLLREGVACMFIGRYRLCEDHPPGFHQRDRRLRGSCESTHIPSKSLTRMLGPTGNPPTDNLFEILSFLQDREDVRFYV